MSETFLSQKTLARRWGISHRTLERWRSVGRGPLFVKVGAHVVYRLSDVERYEEAQVRDPAAALADKAAADRASAAGA
jgi:predicted site-specific integrase-resolvase